MTASVIEDNDELGQNRILVTVIFRISPSLLSKFTGAINKSGVTEQHKKVKQKVRVALLKEEQEGKDLAEAKNFL